VDDASNGAALAAHKIHTKFLHFGHATIATMGFSDFIFNGPFPRSWSDDDWDSPEYFNNKMKTIKLFSCARPHMSAFVSV
jgi:hypothetical protein